MDLTRLFNLVLVGYLFLLVVISGYWWSLNLIHGHWRVLRVISVYWSYWWLLGLLVFIDDKWWLLIIDYRFQKSLFPQPPPLAFSNLRNFVNLVKDFPGATFDIFSLLPQNTQVGGSFNKRKCSNKFDSMQWTNHITTIYPSCDLKRTYPGLCNFLFICWIF